MSNFTDFISGGGGGGGSPFPTMVFQESTTWACPVAMEALVYVIGGGGSGAARGSNSIGQAAGGGAGGCAVSKLTLAAQNYTLTIGSGGAAATGYWVSAGNAGGASSMSGSGITTMTANGGAGGAQGTTVSAVAGGTATGGTLYNNTGGGVPTYGGSAGTFTASGGGAVGLYADGQDGSWDGGNLKMALGGNFMGSSISSLTNNYAEVGANLIYKSNMPITSTPFPNLEFAYSDESINNNTDRYNTFTMGSGKYPKRLSLTSSIIYITPSGPFCGGAGYGGSNGVAQYAAAGIAGGGGGAIAKYASSGFPTSGGGGGGIIIICPISMGA